MDGKYFIKIVTSKDTYDTSDALNHTISTREFIRLIEENCNDLDEPIVFWNDNGYTLGFVTDNSIKKGFLPNKED